MRAPAWLAAATAATGSAVCLRLSRPRLLPMYARLYRPCRLLSPSFLPRSLLFTLRSYGVHGRSVSTEPHRGHVSTERTRANTQTGCGRRQARRLRINRSRPSATDSFANTLRTALPYIPSSSRWNKIKSRRTGHGTSWHGTEKGRKTVERRMGLTRNKGWRGRGGGVSVHIRGQKVQWLAINRTTIASSLWHVTYLFH